MKLILFKIESCSSHHLLHLLVTHIQTEAQKSPHILSLSLYYGVLTIHIITGVSVSNCRETILPLSSVDTEIHRVGVTVFYVILIHTGNAT